MDIKTKNTNLGPEVEMIVHEYAAELTATTGENISFSSALRQIVREWKKLRNNSKPGKDEEAK